MLSEGDGFMGSMNSRTVVVRENEIVVKKTDLQNKVSDLTLSDSVHQNPMSNFSGLSFAAEINDQGLSRLSLRSVKPHGDYSEQIDTGEAYAMEAVKHMRNNNCSALLPWIIEDMKPGVPHSGIEIGFLSMIAKLAVFGVAVKDRRRD